MTLHQGFTMLPLKHSSTIVLSSILMKLTFFCAQISVLKKFDDDTKLAKNVKRKWQKIYYKTVIIHFVMGWCSMLINAKLCTLELETPAIPTPWTIKPWQRSTRKKISELLCMQTFSALQPISSKSKWYIVIYF